MNATLPTKVRASNIGAMLGCDPHKTPLALFHEMRQEVPSAEDNEAMMEGREFEDAIGRIFAKKFGVSVHELRADGKPMEIVDRYISGHPDRRFIEKDRDGILEIKHLFAGGNAALDDADRYGDPGSDQVPRRHWLQSLAYQGLWRRCVQHLEKDFPGLTGYKPADYGYVAPRLRGGVQCFKIPYDDGVYEGVQKEAERFLDRVHSNNPPDPVDEADMRKRWLAEPDLIAEATPEIEAHLAKIREMKKLIRQAEEEVSQLQTVVFGFVRNASVIRNTGGQVLATIGSDRVFDVAAFAAQHPDLYGDARFLKFDGGALKKFDGKLYDKFMRRPESVHEQKRVLRIKEAK